MKTIMVAALVLAAALAPAGAGEKAPDALRKQALDSVNKAEFVIFNTVNEDGFPQTRAMANLHQGGKLPAAKDGKVTLYFVTTAGSNKVRHLRASPKVSAYYLDAKNVTSALFTGTVEEVKDPAEKKAVWADWMKGVYKTPDNPEFVVLRLAPVRVKVDVKASPTEADL